MSRQDDLKRLLFIRSRRLQKLKEAQALKGINAEPELLLEIEDLEEQIDILQEELRVLAETTEPFFQASPTDYKKAKRIELGSVAIEPDLYRDLPPNWFDTSHEQKTDPGYDPQNLYLTEM